MTFLNTLGFVLYANPTIKKLADLKRKIIGVGRPGSADDYGARIRLRKWGLDPDKDVSFLSGGGQPTRLTAIQAARIESLFQLPTIANAKKVGLTELAALADFGIEYLGTRIAATGNMIQKNATFVQRFVRALLKTFTTIRQTGKRA
jgi:NitT/TauT family transport system substrate-binding protein